MSELLGANIDVLERNAQSLSSHSQRVLDIRTLAQRAVAELRGGWGGSNLDQLTQQWEQRVSPLLAGASVTLDTCAAQLRSQAAAQRTASGNGIGSKSGGTSGGGINGGGISQAGWMPTGQPASPPTRGSPADNATWWRTLSPAQQEQVITERPASIGNRDGVSFSARDLANRAMLVVDRGSLMASKARLETVLFGKWTGTAVDVNDNVANAIARLDQVKDKLASLDAIEATLAKPGDRQMVLLDMTHERAQAAIAHGNVESADNVAVFVPGMTITVNDSIQSSDVDMGHLQERAQLESERVSPTRIATTATITWIGYQIPMWRDLLNPEKSGASITAARKGAAQLVPFLRGIGASRDDRAHLTLLGHSYGSTTAGLALRQATGVDDAVFFGSPGLGTDHIADLRLSAGHVHYLEARDDVIGALGILGVDPSHLEGISQASTGESTVVDPTTGLVRHFHEVTGHSSYLDEDSTSQYNVSVIVAGLPDRRVHASSEGLGAVPSFPHL